jgi:hypothetical protein
MSMQARSTMRQTQRALTGRRPSRLLPPPTEDFAEWFLRSQHPATSARLRKEMASTLGPVAICDRLDIDVLLRVAVRQLRFVAGADVVTIHTMNRRTGRLRPRFSTDMARWKRCHPSRPEDPTVEACYESRALLNVANGAGQESEIPNFKGSFLGRFPLVSADFWTSDHLSEQSRSVNAFLGTRARGLLTLKRR